MQQNIATLAAAAEGAHLACETAPRGLSDTDWQPLYATARQANATLAAAPVEDVADIARLLIAADRYREPQGDPEFHMLVNAAARGARRLLGGAVKRWAAAREMNVSYVDDFGAVGMPIIGADRHHEPQGDPKFYRLFDQALTAARKLVGAAAERPAAA